MVDRVGNTYGYGYPQVNDKKVNTNTTGTGEKFQLDYGKEGAIYEPSSEALKRQQDQKHTTTKTQESARAEDEGVRLTLSGVDTERARESGTERNQTGGGILDTVTSIVNKVFDVIKGFISSIWNDEPKVNDSVDVSDIGAEAYEKGSAIPEEIKAEKPKTQFEKAKAEAEAFLASSEGKKVARNSDLLTYYDKHGTVINVSPSDRQRILYGDKNQIEV